LYIGNFGRGSEPPVTALPVLIALLLPHPTSKDPNDG